MTILEPEPHEASSTRGRQKRPSHESHDEEHNPRGPLEHNKAVARERPSRDHDDDDPRLQQFEVTMAPIAPKKKDPCCPAKMIIVSPASLASCRVPKRGEERELLHTLFTFGSHAVVLCRRDRRLRLRLSRPLPPPLLISSLSTSSSASPSLSWFRAG